MSRRVLIADDSAVARVSVARRVRADGIEVVEHDLGDGLGTDVAEQLRAGQGALPIAFFTSTSTPEMLARAMTFGPVFAKPDQLDQAIDWVKLHL